MMIIKLKINQYLNLDPIETGATGFAFYIYSYSLTNLLYYYVGLASKLRNLSTFIPFYSNK